MSRPRSLAGCFPEQRPQQSECERGSADAEESLGDHIVQRELGNPSPQ